MNAKQILAVLAVAMAGNVAMAAEATQFDATPSTLNRADVKAAVQRADRTLMSGGEATAFVDRPVASSVSRDKVRAQVRSVTRVPQYNPLVAG